MARASVLPLEIRHRLALQAGVISATQLAAAGVPRGKIRHLVASGRWKQPLPGAFLACTGAPTRVQVLHLGLAWAGPQALLTGASAAELDGLKGYGEALIHLLVPEGISRAVPSARIRLHRTTSILSDEVVNHPTLPRTSTARSVILMGALRKDPRDAIAVVAAAVQQRLTTPAQLLEALERRRGMRNKAVLRVALLDIAGGAQSLPEQEFAALCRKAGFPPPSRQAVRHAGGKRRYLDVMWEEWGVAIEIDGQQHIEVRRWQDDLARGNDLAISGLLILRFPAAEVRCNPDKVVRTIRRALESRGWSPAR